MRWEAERHLRAAERHRSIAKALAISPPQTIDPPPDEWVITVAFYSAVHCVAGYFWERHGMAHSRHETRRRDMEHESELSPLLDAYDELDDWSRTARYAATPSFTNVEVQQALDHADAIYTAIQHLVES